jgi:beta-lactamase superfamily II metal-dependent hydrolase
MDHKSDRGKGDSEPDCAVYLLDVGSEQYGDSIFCKFGTESILIDGAHLSSKDEIKKQLTELFKATQTHEVSLLIVTHAHTDHIGCLPELIEEGFFLPKWALVADPELGWGGKDTLTKLRGMGDEIQSLVSLLREEPLVNPTNFEIEELRRSTDGLWERYTGMIARLRQKGCQVVRYGKDDPDALLRAFSGIDMSILGPSQKQLELCSELIAKALEAFAVMAIQALSREEHPSGNLSSVVSRAYKLLLVQMQGLAASSLLAEAARNNPAVNDQSIVVCFRVVGNRLLFSGDMQWSAPGASQEVAEEMEILLSDVVLKGNYDLFKLSHHGSKNGFSEELWGRMKGPLLMGICTGIRSKHHPSPETLQELADILQNQNEEIRWVRTDHNGRVGLSFEPRGAKIHVSRGEINDPTPNQ